MNSDGLNTAGLLTLLLSVGGVTLLLGWCIYKVLSAPARDHELAHVEPIDEKKTEER